MFGRALQTVVWQQGTLMTPQHLQHQDAHHHAQLAARLHGAAPRSVGLVHLTTDNLALQEGKISLPAGFVIMPQGEVLHWDEPCDGAPSCRALPDSHTVPNNTLEVFLVLAKVSQNAANVQLDQSNTTPAKQHEHNYRYRANAHALPELTRAQTPLTEIMLARPNVRIAFAHELRDGDCRLHIMTVHRLPHGGAQIDPTFLPQSLRLQALRPVVARLQALHSAVRAAVEQSRPRASSSTTPIESILRHRGLLQLHLALAELLACPYTAPIDVYRQLRACLPWLAASELIGNTAHSEATSVPAAFDDACPHSTLWPLLLTLEQSVAQGPSPVRYYPATQMAKSGLFVANLSPWPKTRPGVWLLQVALTPKQDQALQPTAELHVPQTWTRLAKVAAPSQMPRLIRSALRGINLTPVQNPPQGVAMESNTWLFALDTQDVNWPLIEREGDVVLLPPAPPQEASLEVTVLFVAAEGHAP